MKAPTNIQILKDSKGKPAFAVIPDAEYLSLSRLRAPAIPNAVVHADGTGGTFRCHASVWHNEKELALTGEGNGPIAAFVHALQTGGAPKFEVANYREHALGAGEGASAICYIQIKLADGKFCWGAAVDTNIELASIKAVLSALNRIQK